MSPRPRFEDGADLLLRSLDESGMLRRVEGPRAELADFTSNDVLGLSRHPEVVAASAAAAREHGAGGRASRLLGGGSSADLELERAAADWLGAEAALLFPSGYHANLGVLGVLAGPRTLVVSDERNHASLIDGLRLARARVRIYAHRDAAEADRLLSSAAPGEQALLVTESLFSMDGDLAPLAELAEACRRHAAGMVVDEAHAGGLLGERGAGACPGHDLGDVLRARVVTGGKALGVAGALAVGSRVLRELLINRARTFAFTTAAPPSVVAALNAAIAVAARAEGLRERALGIARRLARELDLPAPAGAIVPFVVGPPEAALEAALRLRERGLDVRAVRPPTVPPDTSRLRIVCHAFNTDEELGRLIEALEEERGRTVSRTAVSPPSRPGARPIVVSGTDTSVGKTVVSALLLRALAEKGACYWKPVQTGADDDTARVLQLAGAGPSAAHAPGYTFARPASPHEAAAAEGAAVDMERLDELFERHSSSSDRKSLVIELAGGLQVPLTDDRTQLDWLEGKRAALVLVARSGLGTLNHTLLSLEALRRRGIEPRALFLVGEPHASNRETLRRLGKPVHIHEVPLMEPLNAAAIAEWVEGHDLVEALA